MATNPFGDRSPAEYTALINALIEFRNAYIPYINATAPAIYQDQPPQHGLGRSRVRQLAVLAEDSIRAAGVYLALQAPPMFQPAPDLVGLSQAAFGHEHPRYRGHESLFHGSAPRTYEFVVDAVDTALTRLETLRAEAERTRQRPTYWFDRGLRAVLGFPAYLISLVFGFDRRDLSTSSAQVLWVVSLVADLVGVAAAGRGFGWW